MQMLISTLANLSAVGSSPFNGLALHVPVILFLAAAIGLIPATWGR